VLRPRVDQAETAPSAAQVVVAVVLIGKPVSVARPVAGAAVPVVAVGAVAVAVAAEVVVEEVADEKRHHQQCNLYECKNFYVWIVTGRNICGLAFLDSGCDGGGPRFRETAGRSDGIGARCFRGKRGGLAGPLWTDV
jgi:hypothetical protein